MRLAIGVIGGLLIGGFLGAQLSGDLVMLTAPLGAGIGAWIAQRGRKSPEYGEGAWQDGTEQGYDDTDYGDGGDD